MTYTRKEFGLKLKEKIANREDVALIGRWAYAVYSEHMFDIDDDFQDFLIDLYTLDAGPEFELPYEKLDNVADRLIAGEKNIELYKKAKNPFYKNR